MAVAHDAVSESHTGTTGSTSESSFSWTHTPTGTPRGVLVFERTNGTTDPVTAITYGGVSMAKVGSRALDNVTEIQSIQAWFLGSGIPTGAQTVQVTRTNNAVGVYCAGITVTAAADTEVYVPGIVILQDNQTLSEQNVDDGSTGVNSMRYAGLSSGLSVVPSAGANSTNLIDIDFSTTVAVVCRENSAGQGSRPVGWSDATSDDVAFVGLAVREVVVARQPPIAVTAPYIPA